MRSARAWASIAAVAVATAACGGAPAPQQNAPTAAGASAPVSVEQAIAELDREGAHLDTLFPAAGAIGAGDLSKKDKDADRSVVARGEDACTVACASVTRMSSAIERLCGLAGEGDGRCKDARERYKSTRARVEQQCPSCFSVMNATPPR